MSTNQPNALLDALEPFAKCCEQISDDEPDHEWAKFRLTIGDYRRAKAAMEGLAKPAPGWDRMARDEAIKEVVGLCNRIPGVTHWNAAEFMFDLLAKQHSRPAHGADEREAAIRHDERKKIIAQGCIHTRKAGENADYDRPDVSAWQADQSEWFDPTICEIVSEYAAWRDKHPTTPAREAIEEVAKGGLPRHVEFSGSLTDADWDRAHKETERLSHELNISNADHIALWLEANMSDSPLAWLAYRIVEAHEVEIRALALPSNPGEPVRGFTKCVAIRETFYINK